MSVVGRFRSRRAQIARLDAAWSRLVRVRAGYRCERCGSRGGQRALNAAHIISRSRRATRWLLDNGVCLDAGCHMYFHRHPVEFYEFVDRLRGPGTVERLRALSQPGRTKIDMGLVAAALEAALKQTVRAPEGR